MFGVRPTATKRWEPSIVRPPAVCRRTPALVDSIRSTFVDVQSSMPSAVRNRAISAEISGSSRPAIRSPASITVTALPKRP